MLPLDAQKNPPYTKTAAPRTRASVRRASGFAPRSRLLKILAASRSARSPAFVSYDLKLRRCGIFCGCVVVHACFSSPHSALSSPHLLRLRKTQGYQFKGSRVIRPVSTYSSSKPVRPRSHARELMTSELIPCPKGCCTMLLTNGDGKGNDEVHAYEVFLNGKRVLLQGDSRNAQAAVSVQASNKIKLVLTGRPGAKVFVLIARDPRQSK